MGDEPTPMKSASPEQAVFAEALQCATPEARAAYPNGACGTDTALRRRVEASCLPGERMPPRAPSRRVHPVAGPGDRRPHPKAKHIIWESIPAQCPDRDQG